MTRRGAIILWIVVSAVVITALSVSGYAAIDARSRAAEGLDDLRTTADQARQLLALRQAATPDSGILESVAGLTPRLSAAIAACGLPASVLASVSPQADIPTPLDNGLRTVHRRATVTLGAITLAQAGKFLDTWRQREPRWIVSSIDIAPETGPAPAAVSTTGGDLPLRFTLTVESISVEQQPPSSSPPGVSR